MAMKADDVYAILNKRIKNGGATDEQIQNAVNQFLIENPVQVGIKVSNTEPTEESVEVWINPNEEEEYQIPEIRDDEESEVDTWSSKKISGKYSELKKNLSELESFVKESDLTISQTKFLQIGFVIGALTTPSASINNTIKYNASIKKTLSVGDELGFVKNSDIYSYKVGNSETDKSFSAWSKNPFVCEEDGEYSFSIRKDNSYTDLTSELQTINESFGINLVEKKVGIPSKYITKDMLSYQISETELDVTDFGVKNDGSSNTKTRLQSLLNLAKQNGTVKLFFPKGTYLVDSTLYYYGRTYLRFSKDATVNFDSKSSVLISNLDSASSGNDYNLGSLSIDGMTIKRPYASNDTTSQTSIGIQACQLERIEVKNCHFIDACAGNHLIDLSGCREVIINNNIFEGMHLPPIIRPTKEANYSYDNDGTVMYTDLEMIQIDHGEGLSTVSKSQNPTKNVSITNNIFKPNTANNNSVIYRPIGMHSVSKLGVYENIRIEGNTFVDAIGRVISMSNARNVKISNNSFINNNEEVFSDIIRMTLMIFGKYYPCSNIEVIGNKVDYAVDTNGFFFFNSALSNGQTKTNNVLLRWNDTGDFVNNITNCTNVIN